MNPKQTHHSRNPNREIRRRLTRAGTIEITLRDGTRREIAGRK